MAEYKGTLDTSPLSFNQAVQTFGILGHEIQGRLVQVRKGVGQFSSDQFFIRKPEGDLITVENVLLNPLDKDLPVDPSDYDGQEYTIGGEHPETGFIIESPEQPVSPSPAFGIAITKKDATA